MKNYHLSEEQQAKYWDGNKNRVIRYYFYIQKGLNLLNEFRYLIMAILAIYAILKIDNWIYMPIMFFGAIPVLIFFGWLSVHHMSRVMEFLSIQYGTHFGRYSVELQEKTLEVQDRTLEVLEKLEKK